jgi:hypothetical protein
VTRTDCAWIDTAKLHDVLDKYGVANSFEVYEGTHTSKVADRIQNHVIPFFSQNLCFQAACPWLPFRSRRPLLRK